MIEKMKKTAVLCQARHRDEVLGSLRDLGVMHLSDTPSHSQGLDALMAERESVVRTMQVLSERGGKGVAGRADGDFAAVDGEVQRLIAEEAALQGRIAALSSERERIALLGSFDPDAFRSLVDMGIFKGIWIGSDKDMKALAASDGVRFIEVAAEGKQRAAVILSGDIPEGLTLSRFALPEKPLDAIDSELSVKMEAAGKAAASIAAEAVHLPLYRAQLARLDEAISFEKAREAMAGDDIACITGYIPASDEAAFKDYAEFIFQQAELTNMGTLKNPAAFATLMNRIVLGKAGQVEQAAPAAEPAAEAAPATSNDEDIPVVDAEVIPPEQQGNDTGLKL